LEIVIWLLFQVNHRTTSQSQGNHTQNSKIKHENHTVILGNSLQYTRRPSTIVCLKHRFHQRIRPNSQYDN